VMNGLRRVAPVRRVVKTLVAERHRERIRSANLAPATLAAPTRERLEAVFADDVARLQRQLGRDLRVWPTVSTRQG
jgi:hypothetical protein